MKYGVYGLASSNYVIISEKEFLSTGCQFQSVSIFFLFQSAISESFVRSMELNLNIRFPMEGMSYSGRMPSHARINPYITLMSNWLKISSSLMNVRWSIPIFMIFQNSSKVQQLKNSTDWSIVKEGYRGNVGYYVVTMALFWSPYIKLGSHVKLVRIWSRSI